MSHRVDFNVHRYGKSVQWNFSMPSTDISMTWRLNYILTYWVRAVCKVYGIDTFKLFFALESEFPRVKIIGYRQLYLKLVTAPYRFTSILKTGTRVEPDDVLPFTDGSSYVAGIDVFKKVQFTKKLRRIGTPTKISRAIYNTRVTPLISAHRAGRELTNLFFTESYCQRYGEVAEGDEIVNAQELKDSSMFGWGDYDSAGFFTLHAAHFSFMDVASGALASMCLHRSANQRIHRGYSWKVNTRAASQILSSMVLFMSAKGLALGTGSSDLYKFTVVYRHILFSSKQAAFGQESLTTNQVLSLMILALAIKKIKLVAAQLRALASLASSKGKISYLRFLVLSQFLLGAGSCAQAHFVGPGGFLPGGDVFDVQDWGLMIFKKKSVGLAELLRRRAGASRGARSFPALCVTGEASSPDCLYGVKIAGWASNKVLFKSSRSKSALVKSRELGSRLIFAFENNLLRPGTSSCARAYVYEEIMAKNATKLLGRHSTRLNLLMRKTKLARNIRELSRTDFNRFEDAAFRAFDIKTYTSFGTRYRKPMLLVDELAQALTIEGPRDESRQEVDMDKLPELQRKLLRGLLPKEVAADMGRGEQTLGSIQKRAKSLYKGFLSSSDVKNSLNEKSGLSRSALGIRKVIGVVLNRILEEKKKNSVTWNAACTLGDWGRFDAFLHLAEKALVSLRRNKSAFSWGLHKKLKIDCADFFFADGPKGGVSRKKTNLRSPGLLATQLLILAASGAAEKTSFDGGGLSNSEASSDKFVSINPGKTEGRGYCEGPAVRDILIYNIDACTPAAIVKPLLRFPRGGPNNVWIMPAAVGPGWWGPKMEVFSTDSNDTGILTAVFLMARWFASFSGAGNWLGAVLRGSDFLIRGRGRAAQTARYTFYGSSPSLIFSVVNIGGVASEVSGVERSEGSGATALGFNRGVSEESYIAGERERALIPYTLEEKYFLLNLRGLFFAVFGVSFDIHYYPIGRVFASDTRMQRLASGLAEFVRVHVSSNRAMTGWLNEFTTIYYASIFTRTTEAMVRFMAVRFKYELYWPRILGLMFKVVKSLNLTEFGIAGIKIGFHGVFGGQPRAFRLFKVWGVNPCLRNGLLTGSHSSAQCLSKYGVVHIHIWLTYF